MTGLTPIACSSRPMRAGARAPGSPAVAGVLDNGLTILFERMEGVGSAAVGFSVATGSRDEPAEIAGVSHFLEHMAFKGTPGRDARRINCDIDDLGAQCNAFTGEEATVYYAWVMSDRLPRTLDLMADLMRPTLPPDEFEVEKKVILEEIAMYEDLPESVAQEAAIRLAFGRHPLGRRVVGSASTVGGMTRARMAAYHARQYGPENLVCAVTGRFDEEWAFRRISELCGTWPRTGARRRQEAPSFRAGATVLCRPQLNREHLVLAVPSCSLRDPGLPAARLLALVLGGYEGSRLFWSVEHAGLADDVQAWHQGYLDGGLLCAYACVDPKRAAKVRAILLDELRRIEAGVSEDELARARNALKTALVFSGETPYRRLLQTLEMWSARRAVRTLEEQLAEIDAVTPDSIARVLAEKPTSAAPAFAAVGPLRTMDRGRRGR